MDSKNKAMEEDVFSTEISNNGILTHDDILTLLVGATDEVKEKLYYLYDIIRCLSIIDPVRRSLLYELDDYLGRSTLEMQLFLDTIEEYKEAVSETETSKDGSHPC